ncbi:MAG: DHA2 family efflux MFS transporter permease subunit [Burkholderiales bacterium]|nr:DHA2 family efflux MFS transporter permease subunit [Burkholderiales bacterium]
MPSETAEVLAARYGPRLRLYATGTVMLGMVASVLTTTIVNVAIPDIMGAFGIGQDRAQWLATGALAAMTIGMLSNAWLVRSFGERRTFVGALALFTGALLAAGFSPNEDVLIGSRIFQGAVAGVMQPLSMYVLFRVFPPEKRGTAMGFFGMSVILGPALGPTLGGILIDHFNWRYVFFAAVPVTLTAMLLGSLFMPQREETGKRPAFDWLGFTLLAAAIGCLLTGLSNGQREGWDSDFVLGMFAIALAAGAGFLAWELSVDQPLVELRVLGNGQFTAAATVAFIFGLGLFGSVYLVPLFVQLVQQYTPLAAGLLLMPAGLILGAFMPIAGYISDHAPARSMIIIGLACFSLSSYWLADVDANTSFWTIAWLVVLSRVGLALIKPSLNLAALRPLRPEQLSQGAGMINFARQLGGAFGVNTLSVMLDRRTMLHSDALTSTQSGANSATAELLRQMQALLAQAGTSADVQSAGALHYLGRVLQAQAYTAGFQDSFLLCAWIFAAALLPAWIMGMRRRPLRALR